MELDKFHILKGQTRSNSHGQSIAGASVSLSCGLVGATTATRSQNLNLKFSTLTIEFITETLINKQTVWCARNLCMRPVSSSQARTPLQHRP